jgi:predicted ribosomally synthesized peptide with nif11-like leader
MALSAETMSEDHLKAFLEAVEQNTSLQETLKAAADLDAVVAIAAAAGFMISADDLKRSHLEISEEDLEGVVGGADCLYRSHLSVFVACPP